MNCQQCWVLWGGARNRQDTIPGAGQTGGILEKSESFEFIKASGSDSEFDQMEEQKMQAVF